MLYACQFISPIKAINVIKLNIKTQSLTHNQKEVD